MSKTTQVIYGPYGWVIGTSDTISQLQHNNCQCGCGASSSSDNDNNKLTLTLIFDRDSLLYDISNLAYVEADVIPDEALHSKHQTADITEEGNVDRVTRILDLTHALCTEALYPYTKETPEDLAEFNDLLEEEPRYVITLKIPTTFSVTTARLLEKLIHEFMVLNVLADWLSITNPNASAKYMEKAQAVLDKVKQIVNTRKGVLLRPLRPF